MKRNSIGFFAVLSFLFLFQLSQKGWANGATYVPPKEKPIGGLELSGNVTVVTGWQHDSKNAGTTAGNNINYNGSVSTINDANHDTYNFYLDQVELDLNKTFGENIRIRADLDFGRFLSGSQRTTSDQNFLLEQGYVTANLGGAEFLIGRYNIPLGLESVDRPENLALSFTNLYRYIRPHNVTGAKFYYAFSDVFDWHIGVVNNLYDTIFGISDTGTRTINDTPIPSFHTRFGFTWGEKGKEQVVGLSGAAGPEAIVPHIVGGVIQSTNRMKHWSFIGDLDYSFHLTDAFVIMGEGIYRQDNQGGACNNIINPNNCKVWAAQITLAYDFNETWNGYLRYEYLHDIDGSVTNLVQQIHSGSIGAGYQITEGAKLKFEYRFDFGLPANNLPKGAGYDLYGYKYWNSGFAVEFAYNF